MRKRSRLRCCELFLRRCSSWWSPSCVGPPLSQRNCHASKAVMCTLKPLTRWSLHETYSAWGNLSVCGNLGQIVVIAVTFDCNILLFNELSVYVPVLPICGDLGQYCAHPIERLSVDAQDFRGFRHVAAGECQNARHVTALQIVELLQRILRDADIMQSLAFAVFVEEVAHQLRHVLSTIAERRQNDLDDSQPV